MTGSIFLQSLAVYIAWRDGKDYGLNAQIAILLCIRNRVAANKYNGDLGKILEPEINTVSPVYELPDVRDPSFTQLSGLAESIFDNTAQDRLTCGATDWGEEPPLGAKERVAQVGTLLLWK